jgi:hypothetical protein
MPLASSFARKVSSSKVQSEYYTTYASFDLFILRIPIKDIIRCSPHTVITVWD